MARCRRAFGVLALIFDRVFFQERDRWRVLRRADRCTCRASTGVIPSSLQSADTAALPLLAGTQGLALLRGDT